NFPFLLVGLGGRPGLEGGDPYDVSPRLGHVEDDGIGALGPADVAGLVGYLDLDIEATPRLTREGPQVDAVVLDLPGQRHPGGVGSNPIEQTDWLGPEVFVTGFPADFQAAVLGVWLDVLQLHRGRRRIHFDDGGRSVALGRGSAAEAVA